MAKDPFEHSVNTHPITPKYREALEWSKRKGEERVMRIRSQNPDFEAAKTAALRDKRVVCRKCGNNLSSTAVIASDGTCLCGERLFTSKGKPTRFAEVLNG